MNMDEDKVLEVLEVLAAMTIYAPNYSATVMPFAAAHHRACVLLDEINPPFTRKRLRESALKWEEALTAARSAAQERR